MSDAADPGAGVPLLAWLRGQRVVCIGGGQVAAAKLRSVLHDGAEVVVVAPDAVPEIARAAAGGELTWDVRPYRPGDVDGAVLVIAATDDPQVNDRVVADARTRTTLCVRAGDGTGPNAATASFLGAVRHGPLLLAVSTGGRAPALTARLRRELAAAYGPEYGELAALLGTLRRDPRIRAAMARLAPEQRRARWRAVLDTDILDLLRTGRSQSAKEVASACLSSSSD